MRPVPSLVVLAAVVVLSLHRRLLYRGVPVLGATAVLVLTPGVLLGLRSLVGLPAVAVAALLVLMPALLVTGELAALLVTGGLTALLVAGILAAATAVLAESVDVRLAVTTLAAALILADVVALVGALLALPTAPVPPSLPLLALTLLVVGAVVMMVVMVVVMLFAGPLTRLDRLRMLPLLFDVAATHLVLAGLVLAGLVLTCLLVLTGPLLVRLLIADLLGAVLARLVALRTSTGPLLVGPTVPVGLVLAGSPSTRALVAGLASSVSAARGVSAAGIAFALLASFVALLALTVLPPTVLVLSRHE